MKYFLFAIILSTYLQGSLFSNENPVSSKQVIKQYRDIYRLGNSITKRGQYLKYKSFKHSLDSLYSDIDMLDIDSKEKNAINNNMQNYSSIVEAIYKSMEQNHPKIDKHYQDSLDGLLKFNKLVKSTGYAPLISSWDKLTKTKKMYIKKPSKKLAKKFYEHLEEINLVLEDLCLDEDLEQPMLDYLYIYEAYFKELDTAYKKVEYANIIKLKELSYELKSQLTLIIN